MGSRRAVWLWLLAVLLPVQASAVAWLAAAGPAHVHGHVKSLASADEIDSEALRRLVVGVGPADPAHAHAPGLRHHHATDVPRHVELDMWSALEGDGGSPPDLPAAASFLPIPAPQPVVHAPIATHALEAHSAWTPTASELARDERPPR